MIKKYVVCIKPEFGLTVGKSYLVQQKQSHWVIIDDKGHTRNPECSWFIKQKEIEVPLVTTEQPPEETSPFTTDSAIRKEYPVYTGALCYFPDAIAELAHLSYLANQKHNPDEPMHWAKEKSADHADCISRHLMDKDWLALFWRAGAQLQTMIENGYDVERELKQYRNKSYKTNP